MSDPVVVAIITSIGAAITGFGVAIINKRRNTDNKSEQPQERVGALGSMPVPAQQPSADLAPVQVPTSAPKEAAAALLSELVLQTGKTFEVPAFDYEVRGACVRRTIVITQIGAS